MYPLSVLVAVSFIAYTLGYVSHAVLTNREVDFERRVALLILVSWLSFAALAYLQDKELSIFFNAAGMGAVGNLLGIKTGELIGTITTKRR